MPGFSLGPERTRICRRDGPRDCPPQSASLRAPAANSRNATPLTIAGILAGIILTAATGSQAGIATIAGTQALAIDNMLRHSRAHEQEADRLGLELLAEAGYDPTGMPAMFERMLRQARLQGTGHRNTSRPTR